MLSIIIPTYNEKEVILDTIRGIKKGLVGVKHEIIVVDDDSPDLTWRIVKESRLKDVRCIRRLDEKSLSSAVIRGFSDAKYDYLLVLDADNQHDSSIIKEMLKHIKNYDFVVGSRFIEGGSVEGWSQKRIFMSKFAASLSRPLLSSKIKDPMSGFFLTKRGVFDEVKGDLSGKGFKIFLEMLFALESRRIVLIKEIPYTFRIRKKGVSKLGFNVVKAYLSMLFFFSLKKYSQLIKFLLVGLSGVFVNTALLWFLTEQVGLFYVLSGIIATEIAIINNFLLNNFWTWRRRNKKHNFFRRLVSFNAVALVGLGISVSVLWFLTELGVYYLISNLVGILFATAWNYLANDKITFKGV
jgi:dolichol-phosphate mannosyltransferase